jgi:hypothetical protein
MPWQFKPGRNNRMHLSRGSAVFSKQASLAATEVMRNVLALRNRRTVINTENPYDASATRQPVDDSSVAVVETRRWLDFRCILVAFLSMLFGAAVWKTQAIFCGTPVFEPSFLGMIGCLTFSGLVTSCIDPRSPWVNCAMLYFGTYILALPFFPRDPLIPLALVLGAFTCAFCVFVGSLIPTTIAYVLPLRNVALRRWAGFVPIVGPH